jgi:phage tail sheath gpL-like
MAISFNNIPTTIRTPGAYTEIDDSRALKGLIQNPHRALIIGQKIHGVAGTVEYDTVQAITNDNLADGFFGLGSPLARMCNIFKLNNPNTELHAIAVDTNSAATRAHCDIDFSAALLVIPVAEAGTWYLMINGEKCYIDISIGDKYSTIATALETIVNSNDNLPILALAGDSTADQDGQIRLELTYSGSIGNYMDIRANYYEGQVNPSCFSKVPEMSQASALSFHNGNQPVALASAWAVVADEQYHYVIQPYLDDTNLDEMEDQLADRFLPLNDLQGHGFTMKRAPVASLTTFGNGRNSPHNTILGIEGSPNSQEEWATALGAVAAYNLNNDPARPLHFLKLKGLLPPRMEDRFTRAERDTLLYDGIATTIVDSGGNVLIERCITTYQKTALDTLDPTWLDVQTVATLGEIRYQYKARMLSRFILPRFKLADDTFPVTPGSKVATPSIVKGEIIALFTLLRDQGLIENLNDFIDNLVIERSLVDRTRVDCILPADLINQFRVLATSLQFIL